MQRLKIFDVNYVPLQYVHNLTNCSHNRYIGHIYNTFGFHTGVAVTIPEGAIKKGATEEVFLAVCRDDKDRPKVTGS